MRPRTAGLVALTLALSSTACSGGPSQEPTATDHGGTLRFAAPQAPAAATPTATTPAAGLTVRAWSVGRRADDLGAAVHAALPVAVAHLGSAARTHVHVEAVEAPGPGAAVVIVVGLEVQGLEVRTTRLGVPVVLVAGQWQPGRPWTLPSGAPSPTDDVWLEALPAEDPALRRAAVSALADAGWTDVVVDQLALGIDTWPHVVRFTAASPDGQRRAHTVWLRRHLDGLVVAGLPVVAAPPSPERPPTTAARQQQDTP